MAALKPTIALKIKAELGECPLWNPDDQCLYWLDIEHANIHKFDPKTGKDQEWPLSPLVVGCFALRDGNGAVMAAQDGIYDFDFATGKIKRLMDVAHDPKTNRFNDGRTDRQGRLLTGTVGTDMTAVLSASNNAYYRIDGKSVTKVISPVGVSNGTAFSPDGKKMYRNHTDDKHIFVHDYDPATGTPSNQRVFAVLPAEFGLPDGATVDTDGFYWAAVPAGPHGGTGRVVRYAPDGKLDLHFDVGDPMPTMVTFGGPNMSTLYITTGRLEQWVQYKVPETSGSIFAVETPFRGLPDAKFKTA
jgi:sugar lactone lactonase YvrE